MTAQNRTVLKSYFETNDIPVESEFADLIDSFPLLAEAALVANNLSDLPNKATARTNLQLGTAALENTSAFAAAAHTHAQSEVTGLVSALAAKADLSGGKIPTAQLPDIAITDYLGTAANQTAMLALSGQKGDWCVRTDDSKVYIITGADPTQVGDWTALSYPTGGSASWGSITGTLSSQSDLQSALDAKVSSNIYTADGSISGARAITLGSNALTINGAGGGNFVVDANSAITGQAADEYVLNLVRHASQTAHVLYMDGTVADVSITPEGYMNFANGAATLGTVSVSTFHATTLAAYAINMTANNQIGLRVQGTVTGTVYPLFTTSCNVTGGIYSYLVNANTSTGSTIYHAGVSSSSTGDPYYVATVSGGSTFSWGIDNSDGDKFKLGPNANPSTGTAALEIDPASPVVRVQKLGITSPTVPSGASDTGVAGTVAWDADYIYICTATNTWKRVAIATW